MRAHLPVLLVVAPLAGAALTPLAAFLSVRLARATALAALAAALLFGGMALEAALASGPLRYHLGGWPPPWGIEYVVDALSGGMAVLVAAFGLLVWVYAGPFIGHLPLRGAIGFHSVYLLLVAGLLGMVVTGDMFNLYVFLEISSIAGYALLAIGGGPSVVASFRYLLLGSAAGSFYLLGLGFLYALTGTLNMADLAARLPAVAESPAVQVAGALIVAGLAIKMGLFPLHGWLPDAYTFAPAPVTGFIAAVMGKVSAYVLVRVILFVLAPAGITAALLEALGWAAAIGAVAASAMALAQTDVRRILAYSSIGQMSYIVLGLAIGTPLAITGALLHVLNHAVMKGCLFLSAGAIGYSTGAASLAQYGGMARRLPVSMAAFTVAAMSLVGLPPTAGFFSKWYLLVAALEEGLWPFAAALVVSSLLSAVYLFRIIQQSFFGAADDLPPEGPRGWGLEAPAGMLAPIVLLALAVVALGLFNQGIVTHVIAVALPAAAAR